MATLQEITASRPEGFNPDTEPLFEFWDADMSKCFARRYGYALKPEITTGMKIGTHRDLPRGAILVRVR